MSKETVQAVILAGGLGKRMELITKNTQKCLLPIDGKPILSHVLDSLVKAFGSVNALICVSFKAEDVKEFVDKNKPNNIRVNYLWDNGNSRTADLYRGAEGHISGPFIGVPGDIVALSDAYKSGFEKFQIKGVYASATLSPMLDVVDSHGVGKVKNEQLILLTFPPPEKFDKDHLRDMTIWCLDDSYYIFARKYPKIGAISNLQQKAIEDGYYIAGNVYNSEWIHVGYPKDLSKTMER